MYSVFLSLTGIVGLTMNLINGIYNFSEMREYAFNVFPKYNIITPFVYFFFIPLKHS